LRKNNLPFSHPIFSPSPDRSRGQALPVPQLQNPQNSYYYSFSLLLIQNDQIRPKSGRQNANLFLRKLLVQHFTPFAEFREILQSPPLLPQLMLQQAKVLGKLKKD